MWRLVSYTIGLFLVFAGAIQPSYSQIQKGMDIDGEAASDQSGSSVSMPNANTVAIGAPNNDDNQFNSGQVRVYDWSGGNWVQRGADIDGEGSGEQFGGAVSMPDDNTIAVGALWNDDAGSNAGQVRVYEWNGTEWIQKGANIDGEFAEDTSGWDVSMPDANTLAIGAPANDSDEMNTGQVRVYSWNGSSWIQKGTDVDGDAQSDRLGTSVSMPDPNTFAVGAPMLFNNESAYGYVRVYDWDGIQWQQKGADIIGEAANDHSGERVSMGDQNTVAIGANQNDGNGVNAGHVRVYSWNGSSWVQKGIDIDGEMAEDKSGIAVSMFGPDVVAIGAMYNSGNGFESGHTRIYEWDGETWEQKGIDIDGESIGDLSGRSVSMPNENTVAIGAPFNDGTADKAGHVRVYSFCTPTVSNISPTSCTEYVSPSNNHIWTNSGIYTDTIPNSIGCDSIITINLTITNNSFSTINPVACEEYSSPSNNSVWTTTGIYTDTIPNIMGCDSIITVDLTINTSSSSSIDPSTCDSYTSPSNQFTWTLSGTYIDTIPNTAGCDSIITVNLTVNTIDTLVNSNSPTLSANQLNAGYQWLDCEDGFGVLPGENGQDFIATSNGNFAVEITIDGCVDTSSCHLVSNVLVIENSLSTRILAYPNPTKGEVFLDLGATLGELTISIRNSLGQEVERQTIQKPGIIPVHIRGESGLYYISIITTELHALIQVVKD